METTFYTVAARHLTVSNTAPAYQEPMAQERVCLHRQAPPPTKPQGRVIDLAAWKQEHIPPQPSAACPTPQPVPPRPSRSARLLGYGEWLATLAVIGTMALLAWRIWVA